MHSRGALVQISDYEFASLSLFTPPVKFPAESAFYH